MSWWPSARSRTSITPDSPTISAMHAQTYVTDPGRSFGATRWFSVRVVPASAPKRTSISTLKMLTKFQIIVGLCHWLTCIFIIVLVCSQLSGAFWDSTTTQEHVIYGRSPFLGQSQIVGENDVPYSDRVIACVGEGRFYEPKLVSSLLANPGESAVLEDSTGTAMHGYRLKQRRIGSESDSLDSMSKSVYVKSCDLIARTMQNILSGCEALGYTNLVRDHLRVVDDWNSSNLYVFPHALPILIMPYWDHAIYARHVIPTWGGDACMFRLEDAYSGDVGIAIFRGVNKSVRYERTMTWLNRPGGYWKNGWYEDLEGTRWYSDVVSSASGAPYYMLHRAFDMSSGKELDCSNTNDCEAKASSEGWGDKFSFEVHYHNFNSVYIANATEFGLFVYEADEVCTVHSVFDWETLLSNVYTLWILHRWTMVQLLLVTSALRGKSQRCGSGICCLSRSKSFSIFPLVSLPRLKTTLTTFWIVGCEFEGQQAAISEAWFAVYPAIIHLVLIYNSILNLLGNVLRRRVSDVLFTPTVIVLCLLHYFRRPLAESGWLSGVDGRVSTLIWTKPKKYNYLTSLPLILLGA
ncbi:unnamed protein product [Phytophthora fragariaefolia]|uniref:Unnamed protein product n=1 Tax=Phytophthora fragariaefolia TaxID=1490495 RepID=A0A9W7D0V3_9STRA|nr:unnamed protein product [Phytophthora fragariaefolia]